MAKRSPIWHPFTQHQTEPSFKKIIRTDGAYLTDEDGQRIFDAISSWWVTTHGHRHPRITQAIQAAAERFDQVIFAEYSHHLAEEVAEGLIDVAPPGMAHVFFSDSGSTSVEVALKMALGFFSNRRAPRSSIVVMEHSYHGDTIGTMSTGARGVFNSTYEPLLFDVERIPFPEPGEEQRSIDALEVHCQTRAVAAFLVEPLVLGAGGMKMYPPRLLAEYRRITAQYDTLMIADEVMTAWGRTGTLFACEQSGITPDIMCLSKGLTAGALPLAVTLCTPEVFEAHLSDDRARMFFHSSSYTANPIACAAALANLEVWRDEPVLTRIQNLADLHHDQLEALRLNPRFVNVRQQGTIAALDLSVQAKGYLSETGQKLRSFFRSKKLLIRPLGNIIYLMPPYCATAEDLNLAYATINEAVDNI
nr:adenosylmethionine--8-amino-7-oxononanoate transaminase [Bradyrhizobium canariense]